MFSVYEAEKRITASSPHAAKVGNSLCAIALSIRRNVMTPSRFGLILTLVLVIQMHYQGHAQQPFWQQTSTSVGSVNFNNLWITGLQFNSQGKLFAATQYDFSNFFDTLQTGVFYSSDNGASWAPTGLTYRITFYGNWYGASTLLITPSDHIFAAAGSSSSIFLSTDNGVTWREHVITGVNVVQVLAVNSSGHIFAAARNGIFRSTDNGQTWIQKNNGLGNMNVNSLAISSSGIIFAGTDAGTYRSTNNGESWTGGGTVRVYGLAIHPLNGYVFAATNLGIYRSTDNGQSWTNVAFPNQLTWVVSCSPAGEVFISTGSPFLGGEIHRSKDNGATWTKVYTANATCFAFGPGKNIFFGSMGAVYRSSDNGNTWTSLGSAKLTDVWILSLANTSSAHLLAATYGKYVFRTTDRGATWTQLSNGLTNSNVVTILNTPNGYIFAGTDSSGIFRSSDNGRTWMQTNTGLQHYTYVYALTVGSNGKIFAGCNSRTEPGVIFSSSDNGLTWNSSVQTVRPDNVYSLAASGATIVAGTQAGKIYISKDNGSSWITTKPGTTLFRAVAIAPDGTIFAGSDYPGGLYRSRDQGQTWIRLGFTDISVTCLFIDRAGTAYLGTFGKGIFRSTDGGNQWRELNDGLTTYDVRSLLIDRDGYLYAGTGDKGVFRSTSIVTYVENTVSFVPTTYFLYQNYPNPFNPSTSIQFSLPRSEFVTLTIYNTLGQQVASLLSENMSAGIHRVEWNAHGLPSGAYYYRLHAGAFTQTKKLILLR
jgi:photosystem II stability/assembly factor-like uncharacterized protein